MILGQVPGSLETAGAVAVALGLVEIVKRLVDRSLNGTNGRFTREDRKIMNEVANKLREVSRVITAVDDDRVPLVYVPRRMLKILEEIRDEMRRFNAERHGG